MAGLVLKASESSVTQKGNWWDLNAECEILSAFSSYQFFDDPNSLSGLN